MNKPQPKSKSGPPRRTITYLVVIGVLCLACYYPVTKYFFAQDDFILLANAVFHKGATVGATLGGDSDLFRPLTKIFFFEAAHALFGLDAFPYHLLSIILHVLNVVLVYLLLRRFRIDRLSSVVVSALFGFNAGFFDVVAWASCIQQLAGQAFMLAGLIMGIRGMQTRTRSLLILGPVCYALALLSLEQTYALAPLLFLHAFLRDRTGRAGVRAGRAFRDTAPYLALLAVYLVYMGVVKGIPEGGPYAFHFGSNVVSNLLTYSDWALGISAVMPFFMDVKATGLTAAHLLLALMVLYNLSKGRGKLVLFGAAYYVLTILPVLFLEEHTFYLHNYVPAVGIAILAAPVVEDLFEVMRRGRTRLVPATALIVVGLAAAICFTKVRTNETNYVRVDLPIPKDFVLRRAVIAQNVRDDLVAKTRGQRTPAKIFLVYGGPKDWYMDNVVAALGRGSAVNLFFSRPDLVVSFHEKGDALPGYDPANSRLFFFEYTGHLLTPEEMSRKTGSPVEVLEPR
jgi:hypothetical protein